VTHALLTLPVLAALIAAALAFYRSDPAGHGPTTPRVHCGNCGNCGTMLGYAPNGQIPPGTGDGHKCAPRV
jgi:hypothetical protein